MRGKKYTKFGVVLALIMMVIGVAFMMSKYKTHQESLNQKSEIKLNQVSSYYDQFFEDKIETLNEIANNQMILNYFKEVRKIEDLETHYNYKKVHQFLIEKKENTEDIGYLYISSNHVKSILSEPYFEAPKEYTAADRGWFKTALESDDIIGSPVYVDVFTLEPIITLSRTIKDTDVHGVVGMDVNMEKVINYINEQGNVLLIDDQVVIGLSENLKDDFGFVTIQDLIDEPITTEGTYETSFRGFDLTIHVLTDSFTGHQIFIVNDNAVENRLIISSLVQTFVVFLIMSCLVVVLCIRIDKKQVNKIERDGGNGVD